MKTAYFNRFSIELPDEAVTDCHHQGACDADVAHWAPKIPRSPKITADKLRAELEETGGWDTEELADDEANWRRILWIAAGDIQEEMRHLTYHINLDERGEFRADVRRLGETVFEIEGFDIFEDGFMQHNRDTAGLLDYLRHLEIAAPGDTLERA